MKKSGSYLSATALGSVTAVAALLVGLSGANAQAPVPAPPLTGAGSFPGSFIVPGTNTSLHVGGVIEMDVWEDSNGFNSGATSEGASAHLAAQSTELQGPGIANVVSANSNHGTIVFTPQFSRFYFDTRTPTPYGELKTYIEVDFDGSMQTNAGFPTGGTTSANFNQGYIARVKQAYGTLGPWLMGQAASNFADLDAWPDTLDAPAEAGAFMGVTDYRVPQIRFTYLLPGGNSVSASVEDFQSGGVIGTTGTGALVGAGAAGASNFNTYASFSERMPAFTATARTDQPWGHAAFHAAVAQEEFRNLSATGVGAIATGGHEAQWGYQLALSGHLNTYGQDKLTWQLGYGDGAAQYNEALNGQQEGAQYQEGLICSVGGVGTASQIQCSQARALGVNAGYSHHWTDTWRSTLAAGYDQESRPNSAATWGDAGLAVGTSNELAELSRKTYSAAINLLWRPVPAAQFGIEDDYYQHTVWSGAHGKDNRVHFQALFSF